MEKVKTIVSKFKQNVNLLNNEEFVHVCSSFFENLLFVDDKVVKNILIHDGNKIILKELNTLSKSNGNFIFLVLIFITMS